VLLAEIDEPLLQLVAHLLIGRGREADPALRSDAFQPRGNIDAVAHQVAIALLDDVAEMHADAQFDAALGRYARVALHYAGLHLDRAAKRVDDAAELYDAAIPGSLDVASVMGGDGRVNQIAAETAQTRERAVFVGAREPAVTDHVRDQKSPKSSGSRYFRVSPTANLRRHGA